MNIHQNNEKFRGSEKIKESRRERKGGYAKMDTKE